MTLRFRSENTWVEEEPYGSFVFPLFYDDKALASNTPPHLLHAMGTALVIDKKQFGDSALWKVPGGHSEEGETPEQTASRELGGEAGLIQHPREFHYFPGGSPLIRSSFRPAFRWRLFATAFPASKIRNVGDKVYGNEGEEARYFSVEEFWRLCATQMFIHPHFVNLVQARLIDPITKRIGFPPPL
jgi:8-oxo-dGTP pyrophosphatase MutT (NUDIX family)